MLAFGFSQGGKFRGAFLGYDRVSVDAEFNRLLEQNSELEDKKSDLESSVQILQREKDSFARERMSMSETVNSMSGQVLEMESNVLAARTETSTMQRTIEAQKSELSALHLRFDHLRERDRDFSLREREFAELQSSVSSIMSVTKRATDRVFQKAVDSQERISRVAGDAAREVAAMRMDIANVRQQLNGAMDEFQDRIDRVDATLTGAVHKLVAVKHSDDLQTDEVQPDVLTEVERLLSLRSGEVDISGGRPFAAPNLGTNSARFLSDTARKISDGRISVNQNGVREAKKAMQGYFDTNEESIDEARNLLDRGGMSAGEYYEAVESDAPLQPAQPIQIGFAPPQPAQNAPVSEMVSTSAVSGDTSGGNLTMGAVSSVSYPPAQSIPVNPTADFTPARITAQPRRVHTGVAVERRAVVYPVLVSGGRK